MEYSRLHDKDQMSWRLFLVCVSSLRIKDNRDDETKSDIPCIYELVSLFLTQSVPNHFSVHFLATCYAFQPRYLL